MRRREAITLEGRPDSSPTLWESVTKYEGELIAAALIAANGSVTKAAVSLGVSYQALSHILKTRQRDLLVLRKAIRPRRQRVRDAGLQGNRQSRLLQLLKKVG